MLLMKWSPKRQRNGVDCDVVLMTGDQRLTAGTARACNAMHAYAVFSSFFCMLVLLRGLVSERLTDASISAP